MKLIMIFTLGILPVIEIPATVIVVVKDLIDK